MPPPAAPCGSVLLFYVQLLYSFITRQAHGISIAIRLEFPTATPPWPPSLPQAHQLPTACKVYSFGLLLPPACRLPLPPCSRCCPDAAASELACCSTWWKEGLLCAASEGDAGQNETCPILPWALSQGTCWISRCHWQSCWVPCSWRPLAHSMVPLLPRLKIRQHMPCPLPSRERIQRNKCQGAE